MAQAQFPEPKDLEVPVDQRIGDGKPMSVGKFTLDNPHPDFGKDPNILNEYGHTVYPKWVKNAAGDDVVVNNADEEAEIAVAPEAPTTAKGWGK